MSTYTIQAVNEAAIVRTLGNALASILPMYHETDYRQVARLIAAAESYEGSLTLSPQFAYLDRLTGEYGVVWTLHDDGTFIVQF